MVAFERTLRFNPKTGDVKVSKASHKKKRGRPSVGGKKKRLTKKKKTGSSKKRSKKSGRSKLTR